MSREIFGAALILPPMDIFPLPNRKRQRIIDDDA